MSWKKAMAAGAKQQVKNAKQPEPKATNVKRTFGGKCIACGGPATVKRGSKHYCRPCAEEMFGG